MMHFKHNVIMAVKEMLERNWDVYTMAARLKLDPSTVQAIVDMINNVAT